MSSSCIQSGGTRGRASLSISGELFTPDLGSPTPGSFNDELVIRGLVTEAIKNCSKSRQEIADEMTTLLGMPVTKRALDSYTSESADQNRFPAQYLRAFCHATGDWSLIHCVSQRAGLHVISKAEQKLLELGREYLRRKKAEKTISAIEQEFEGVDL